MRGGREGRHGQHIRHECKGASTMQASHTVKENQVTAMVAIKDTHGLELIPVARPAAAHRRRQGYSKAAPERAIAPRDLSANRCIGRKKNRSRAFAQDLLFWPDDPMCRASPAHSHQVTSIRGVQQCCCALRAHDWYRGRCAQLGSFRLATWQSPTVAPCH